MKKEIREKGALLFDAGFDLVPIKNGAKHPNTPNWTKIRATRADITKWGKSAYYGGWGILGEFTPGIDIDVLDKKIVLYLLDWCNQNIGFSPIRLGRVPKILLPCQPPFGKKLGQDASNKYKDTHGNTHQIEIKATGRQWVAYGIHKDTKNLYRWTNKTELYDYSPDTLPILTGDKINQLFDYFYSLVPPGWERIWKRKLKTQGIVTDAGSIIDEQSFENYKPPLDITIDQLRSMLQRLNPDAGHDVWMNVGMALYHQFDGGEDGLNLFVEWSQRSKDYDYEEIQTRWPTWGSNSYSGNPITAATIVKWYNDATEKSKDSTLKRKSKKLSDWEKRFALVELCDGSEVYNMAVPIWQAKRRTLQAFKEHNTAYTHQVVLPDGTIKIVPMVDAWKSSFNTRHFAGYTYQPGNKRYCTAEHSYKDNAKYINTFFFPPHDEIEDESRTKIFFKFLSHLFPEEKECDWIIGWLARMIQNPGTRSFVTPLNITPVTGTGRGLFFEIIRRLVGGHNTHDVSRDDLEGRFNGYLDKCIVAVVQEIKAAAGDRKYQMWERMKSLLADNTANIQSKGRDSYTATICANFILFSNNINALPIEDVHERRIYAMRGAPKPISPADVDTLINWMKEPDNIAALFYYLKSYKVNHNDYKRAVVTETKKQMVIASAGESKIDLIRWLETEAPEVFDFEQAAEYLESYSQDIAEQGISRRVMRQCITDQGWRSKRITVEGRRVYVYYNPNKTNGNLKNLKFKYQEGNKNEISRLG